MVLKFETNYIFKQKQTEQLLQSCLSNDLKARNPVEAAFNTITEK